MTHELLLRRYTSILSMAFCDVCGDTLREDEEDREIKGKQVCDECLHNGLEALQKTLGKQLDEGLEELKGTSGSSDENK